jgi:serine/threonine-protein kinase
LLGAVVAIAVLSGRSMDDVSIGQYRVTGLIGRGGMGAVYAAEHALLGRPAAIKVLLPELSQKQDVVTRFFNEARAATAIRHPGIIEIYDFGWTPDGAAFIVMERLEGETLARRSARLRLRWPAVLAIARQIAGALSAAHVKGIVHRDLKPDNVFLVPDPEVPGGERIKLLDFGIAKLAVDSTTSSNVTKTGAVMGTPTYMAPEQCRGVVVDHRADLYSLGCVIYELCCGRPPFVGEGSGDVLAAHIHLPVPPITAQGAELPPAVEQLILHLLAKAPADRMHSAEELIRAIDAVTADQATVTSGPRRAPSVMTSPSVTTLSGSATTSMLLPRAGRRRWSIAAFSVGLAAITVVVVVLVMRRGAEAPAIASHPADPTAVSAQPATAGPPPGNAPAVPLAEPEPGAPRTEPSVTNPPPPTGPAESAPAGTALAGSPAAGSSAAGSSAAGSSAAGSSAAGSSAAGSPAAGSSAAGSSAAGSSEGSAVPAQVEPAVPGRSELRAPAGSDPSRHPPRSRSTAGAQRESALRSQDPGDPIAVAIDSTPSGAQVVLDGTMLGTTPYRGTLPRRDRDVKLVVRLAGYNDRAVVAHGSQPISQSVTLVRKPALPATKNPKTDRDRSVNPF